MEVILQIIPPDCCKEVFSDSLIGFLAPDLREITHQLTPSGESVAVIDRVIAFNESFSVVQGGRCLEGGR